MAEYLFLIGLSGAGRSTAAATLEDRDWFVIDNLPPSLLGKVAELANQPGSEYEKICLVAGRGGYEGIAELPKAMASLRASGARVRVVFLDAPDDVLVRRYEGTRRRHPIDTESGILDAIRLERAQLSQLRDEADIVIDTGELNVHDLRDKILELVDRGGSGLETTVVSFGYKYGIPLDADLVFDCRFLPNPHWVPELRPLSGLDAPVREYVMAIPEARQLLEKLEGLFDLLLPAFAKEGKSYLSIAIGCTGGHHRSVVLAEEMGELLRRHGFDPSVHHRDIDR
jgi:UPF0042 nucleotide-binding protein